jgi:diadenosine tetraphosphate (Ap4A) HIT family hydrolase
MLGALQGRIVANAVRLPLHALASNLANFSRMRILANHGPESNQEVPHLHVQVFGGQRLGRMIEPLARVRQHRRNLF